MPNFRDNDKEIIVDAQGYGIGHRFKQYLTPGGWKRMLNEKLSPAFQQRMDLLRDSDESMRREAILLKDWLKSANKAFKDGRYIDVAHYVSQINNVAARIVRLGKLVTDLADEEIAEYYSRTEEADLSANYFDKSSADDGIATKTAQLQSYAGIADLLNRFMGGSLEKTYWRKVKERKLAVQNLLKHTERLVATILTSLDRMGTARAQGNISDWLTNLNRINLEQQNFQKTFKSTYEKHISDLVELAKARQQEAKTETEEEKEEKVTETESASETIPSTTNDKTVPVVQQVQMETHSPSAPQTSDSPTKEEELKEEKKERGRPRSGDGDRQFDQIELLLKNLREKQQSGQDTAPEVEVKPEPELKEELKPEPEPEPQPEPQPEPEPVVEQKSAPVEIKEQESEEPTEESVLETPKEPEVSKGPEVSVETPKETPAETPAKESPKPEKKSPVRINLRGRKPKADQPKTEPAKSENKQPEKAKDPSEPKRRVVELKKDPVKEEKPPVKQPIEEPKVEEPKEQQEASKEQKVTFVLLPKGGAENLDVLKENLSKELGHDIVFVTKESGAAAAKEYQDKKYEIDLKHYEEVKQFASTPEVKEKSEDDEIGDLLPSKETEETGEMEDEQKIFIHTGKLEELLGKKMSELTEEDAMNLLNNENYIAMLPRNKEGDFDFKLIEKFPEIEKMGDVKRFFFSTLKTIQKDEKKKSAGNVNDVFLKYSHRKFMQEFQKAASAQNVNAMVLMLCKYSEEIDDLDPDTSYKLLVHAEKLMND